MPRKQRSREDLAWVAGFWDGEGTVGIANTNTTRGHPVFQFCQAGWEAKALLQRVFDVIQIPGALNGPYEYEKYPHWQPRWQLRITGFERVQAALAMCWPWLSETKRQQAVKALRTFHRTHPSPEPRTHCPRCKYEWVEPNIVFNPVNNSWRCRVCRRKNPDNARPNGQWRRKHVGADQAARRPNTHERQRVIWD